MNEEKVSKRHISRGTCNFCQQTVAKSGISRHLKSCKTRLATIEQLPAKEKLKSERVFHLAVEGTYAIDYWMHIEIPASAALTELDRFLRDVWLECCGHLSEFTISGVGYQIDRLYGQRLDLEFDDDDAVAAPPGWRFPTMYPLTKRMSKFKLADVLKPETKFTYRYDFGSTTDLTLKMVEERKAEITKTFGVQIIARNHPPEYVCQKCGEKLATHICMECVYDGKGLLCKACAKKHPKDHYDMFLPVVNSPRMGECAYVGDVSDDWAFW